MASLGLSDPTTFFKTLLLRPYLRQARPCLSGRQGIGWLDAGPALEGGGGPGLEGPREALQVCKRAARERGR